ncbi:phage major tail protein, TP901-1 family [Coralliovum pocilloporae]|uniref:phage major tail protein, TP901-1 family n=1 Tax=Coralliovum pocilloporae TaxID=3066369 RepID=UPI0033079B57
MTAQRGKDLLLKVMNDQNQPVTVAGLRSRQIILNTEPVDTTDSDSAGRWRELLAGAGTRRAAVSGTGIFKDASSDALIRQLFFDGTIRTWQIVIPDFVVLSGLFQLTSLQFSGEHDREVLYELTLESAGVITSAEV